MQAVVEGSQLGRCLREWAAKNEASFPLQPSLLKGTPLCDIFDEWEDGDPLGHPLARVFEYYPPPFP